MKIVIIEQDIDVMGGVERIISTLANSFSEQNEVFVISEHKNSENTFFKYKSNIKIYYLIKRIKYNRFERKNSSIINKIWDYISTKRDEYITYYISKDINDVLKQADCIIFGRVQVALKFIPYIKRNNIKCKIIVRDAIHLEAFNKKQKRKLKKYFPNYVDTFIVSSNESIENYNIFFGNNNSIKIKKIYNPIGIKPYGEFDFSKKTIVSLGRLDNQKGFDDLILAFDLIHKRIPDWKLKIYGKGPFEGELRKIIEKKKLNSSVEILSSTKNVVEVFNNSSIFVMTSRYEGYANILVEAMACGMPVISYDWLMGVHDIIKKDVNGIIVPLKNRMRYFESIDKHENITTLSQAIEELIKKPENCKRLSENAKKIAESRNIDIIIRKWNEVINNNDYKK